MVRIEAAGDHKFDMRQIQQEGTSELFEKMLEIAKLPTGEDWRLLVDKKLVCSGETPPVRVTSIKDNNRVSVRLKAGNNDSCHQFTVYVPNLLTANEVFDGLKRVASRFTKNWRSQSGEDLRAEPKKPLMPIENILKSEDRTKKLLYAIFELGDKAVACRDDFIYNLINYFNWQDCNRRILAGTLAGLSRNGFICQSSKNAGAYCLTGEGFKYIMSLLPADSLEREQQQKPQEHQPLTPIFPRDPLAAVLANGEEMEKVVAVYHKLRANREERNGYAEEVARLDKEAEELSASISDCSLINKLLGN